MFMQIYTALLGTLFSISSSTMKVNLVLKFTTQKNIGTLIIGLVKGVQALELFHFHHWIVIQETTASN